MRSIGHGWTYASHPLCAAAGVANLELVDELDLVANAREVGSYFKNALNDALGSNRFMGEGLMAAVEFVRDRDDRVYFDPSAEVGTRIAAALLERGVIGRAMPQSDIVDFAPPLCLTKEEADIVVTAAKDALESVAASLYYSLLRRARRLAHLTIHQLPREGRTKMAQAPNH